ncbi:MAG: glycosyltransferase [Ktedonobacteraceae bacterium]
MYNRAHNLFFATPISRTIALLALFYTVYYLLWRATSSLNMDALWFSLPLLLIELYGAINFALFLFMTWDLKPVPHAAAPGGRTVDIFIPTYNEDLSILRMTILGALNVHYPHETWVLDDGQRPALRQLCEAMHVHYLTRPDNKFHKAGNINAALTQTNGEFIAIFDADQIPFPGFIDQTLGYFVDEKVAFVQTPQEFYNLDSVQHKTNWQAGQTWHEQSLFYNIIQPGKNRWNAAFWCGSNSIMRRSALLSVGGIATETVTEDIHTSLRLHAAGWKSIYHNELLSMGLAPQDFLAFTVQRLRWGQGAMQVLRRENPLFKHGLTFVQRLNYLSSITTYFEAYQRLVYTLAPSIVLFTAVLPIHTVMLPFVVRFVPYIVLGILANITLGKGRFRPIETELYNLLKMVTFIKASLVLLGLEPKSFKVTPKGASKGLAAISQLVWPYYALIAVQLLSMLIGGLRIANLLGDTGGNISALLISEGWALFNLFLFIAAIRAVLQHMTRRNTYRFPVHVPVTVLTEYRSIKGITANVHEQGLALLLNEPLLESASVRVMMHLPQNQVAGTLMVRASQRTNDINNIKLWHSSGPFTPDTPIAADTLDEFLISIMAQQMHPQIEPALSI